MTHSQLRALALAARHGDWYVDRHSKIDKFFSIYDCANRGTEIARIDYDDVDHEQADANAAFIAAANPATVLSLLDQLSAMTAARDELAEIAEDMLDSQDGDLECIVEAIEHVSTLKKVGSR